MNNDCDNGFFEFALDQSQASFACHVIAMVTDSNCETILFNSY